MRPSLMRTLAALAVAGAATSPSGLGPTAAAAFAPAAATTYLRVSMSCDGTYCEAIARGGTGIYTQWDWELADELWEGGNVSAADASGHCYSGLVLGPGATVTDSSGATAGGSATVFC